MEPSRGEEVLEDQDISAARKGEHPEAGAENSLAKCLLRRELQVLKASTAIKTQNSSLFS